jgi:murein DD-endopeptidase MepM/ murein hydrolase activator NlpD
MRKNLSKRRVLAIVVTILVVIGAIFYKNIYSFIRDNVIPAAPLTGTVLTPSVNNAAFYSTEAYGGPDAPWGFYHNGIDFMESTNHQAIQAAADGKVVRLVERFNAGSRWQVELTIEHGPYDLQYAFEIFSGNKQDIDTQLADITVKLGQYVHRGQIIGNLHRINEGAHVHFGIAKNNQVVCPEPFFTAQARANVLTMIRKTYPGANMCYPADPTAPRKTPTNNVQTNILTK